MSDTINAQHEETGRTWSGPRGELPKGYSEVLMTEQAENELIAEKLLGWKSFKTPASIWWVLPSGRKQFFTPTFETWAEAGLILEALTQKERHFIDVWNTPSTDGQVWQIAIQARGHTVRNYYRSTGPLAIRSAALAYLRAQE
jgi:hypothetical protein